MKQAIRNAKCVVHVYVCVYIIWVKILPLIKSINTEKI